ncbi:MAG: hypothetical protein LBL16_00320 [Endomicrobium sp.]|jgi:hypothetical protein|nr:hypothetical protein [Endomicrobium sp.]
MKRILAVMVVSCFSFIFTCHVYGGFFDTIYSFFRSNNRDCIKAISSFNTASLDLLNELETERATLMKLREGNITEIKEQCILLGRRVELLEGMMLTVCNKRTAGTQVKRIYKGSNDL